MTGRHCYSVVLHVRDAGEKWMEMNFHTNPCASVEGAIRAAKREARYLFAQVDPFAVSTQVWA